ncbi:MAG TPA: septum formation initiator family protein [Candidatus Monoglobus merdigallinarum]|uniref:Septum formation initiator family protein n=1 Tax=Candidatus Monoglobus merdigallinarum TaxID=2838698 RepID=A0A9D1PSY4_9FIRM|nr:septum formation initiator family protein [Candidatus Monoglobus merdigallinarum]
MRRRQRNIDRNLVSVGAGVRNKTVSTIKKTGRVKLNFKRLFVCVGLFAFCIYFLCVMVSQQQVLNRKNKEIAEISEQISIANSETERLRGELESVNDPEYLERMAREKLGLTVPNERVFVDKNSSN